MPFHRAPTTYVGEVHLNVQNLEQSIQFYEEVIGFHVLEKTSNSASFTTNGENKLLTIEQPEDVMLRERGTTGLYHFALLLPTRRDLANIVRHFVKLGLRFGSADHLVSEALYLSDLDGNGIEIYVDRDASEWHWQNEEVAMTTDPLNFQDLLEEGQADVWNGLPEKTTMGHIHLQVDSIRAAEEFYVQGLGFNIVSRYGTQALFISDNGYHHHIAMNTWAGEGLQKPSENQVGLKSYAIIYPDENAREEVLYRLQEMGFSIMKEKDSYYVEDPAHIKILLDIYKGI